MRVEWSAAAQASALRFMRDQDAMRAIVAAVDALPVTFHAGEYHRLRVGQYSVFYRVDGDVITIERVDRVLYRRGRSADRRQRRIDAALGPQHFASPHVPRASPTVALEPPRERRSVQSSPGSEPKHSSRLQA